MKLCKGQCVLHYISCMYGWLFSCQSLSTNCESHVCSTSVRLSTWNTSAPTRWILMNFDILVDLGKLSGKFKFHSNRTRITGILHEYQYTFFYISLNYFRMRNVSDQSYRRNQNTHFVIKNSFFF